MFEPAAVQRVARQVDAFAAPHRETRAVGLESHLAFDDALEFERAVPVAVEAPPRKRG